jgi:hypothetical protein
MGVPLIRFMKSDFSPSGRTADSPKSHTLNTPRESKRILDGYSKWMKRIQMNEHFKIHFEFETFKSKCRIGCDISCNQAWPYSNRYPTSLRYPLDSTRYLACLLNPLQSLREWMVGLFAFLLCVPNHQLHHNQDFVGFLFQSVSPHHVTLFHSNASRTTSWQAPMNIATWGLFLQIIVIRNRYRQHQQSSYAFFMISNSFKSMSNFCPPTVRLGIFTAHCKNRNNGQPFRLNQTRSSTSLTSIPRQFPM